MTESPRPKIPSILRKSNAKADDILAPSDTFDSQGSPLPGKSQENELSDDITVHGIGKSRQQDEAKSSAIKKFNKTGVKNQSAKDNSAGLKKSTLNTVKSAKDFKAGKKTAETAKPDMEDDIENVGEEQEEKKETAKGGHKKGKKSVDVDAERESEEKQAESGDEEDGITKKGNKKVKVLSLKNAKGTTKGKNEEKKESSPEKKSSKKEEEAKDEEEEEAPKPKELPKPKAKGKTFLGAKDNKENAAEKKSKEKTEKEKEKEKSKEKEKEKDKEEEEESKTKESGAKLDPLKREKKKISSLSLGKTADKSTDKDKGKGKEKEKEKDKKSDKKEVSSMKDKKDKKDKKDTDKKDKKKETKEKKEKKPKKANKKEEEDPEEDEAAEDDEEDEDVNESQLSQLVSDDEEDEDDFSGDERDIMIFARGADEDSNDIPKEQVDEDGVMQMISSKGGRSPVVDTYWKKHVRKSKGSSAKRKASEITNPHVYDAERILKMAKASKKVIMYSGLELDDLDILDVAVAKLPGGFVVNTTPEPLMTHLIYNGTKRTMKLLYAIAKRAWVLVPSFLYLSLEFGDWAAEKDCEFAGVKSKNFRDTYGPLFKDMRFFFNHGDLDYFQTINIGELKKLVKLAGGKLTEKAEEAEVIIEDADNRKNSLAPKKFEGNQPHVVSYKWILDSLMEYTKLSYQEFDILM